MPLTEAKRYRAHGNTEEACIFNTDSGGRNDKFSKMPASA